MPVQLRIERGPHRGVPRAEIVRRAVGMLACLQLDKAELSIILTDDDQIHILNKTYRGKDKATDVLAFAMREGDFGRVAGELLGDVIVSVPTARRQASERGKTVLEEVTMLLAHGLLHLLGWDHDTPAKDVRMRAETDRLCAAVAPQPPRRAPARRAPPARPAPKRARPDARQRKQGRKV